MSDGMANSDLTKPIRLSPADWEQLNEALEGEQEVSELDSIIEADDLENLKRQLAYTFLDAYGNFDGADVLFEAIVRATEERIIKLLEDFAKKELERLRNPDTKVMAEEHLAYYEGLLEAMFVIKGERK